MTVLSRLLAARSERRGDLSLDDWASFFNHNGLSYPFLPQQTLTGDREEIERTFAGYVQSAYKSNGVIFACCLARMMIFSEARFQFRRMRKGRPGELFGTEDLAVLEKPDINQTTRDLLKRAMQDADLGGNWFGWRPGRTVAGGRVLNAGENRIVRLRPDWMTILVGSAMETDDPNEAIDARVIGYLFHPGGHGSGRDPVALMPEEVAHFAPIPDPIFHFRGMSWISPIIEEIAGDKSAMRHKRKFFEQGATVNLAVTDVPARNPEEFERWVSKFNAKHQGGLNAFKTVFMAKGADLKVIGSDLKQIDFKNVQGHGETRVAAAAGIPPVIVGLSEGLEASSYAHYAAARRRLADGTMRPLWGDMAGSLATVVDVPSDADLHYDDRDIPFLQEDIQDAATIQKTNAEAIRSLTDAGYDPKSVVDAVTSGDLSRLKHLGVFSVQLHPPGEGGTQGNAPGDDEPGASDAGSNGNGAATSNGAPADDDAGRALRALVERR